MATAGRLSFLGERAAFQCKWPSELVKKDVASSISPDSRNGKARTCLEHPKVSLRTSALATAGMVLLELHELCTEMPGKSSSVSGRRRCVRGTGAASRHVVDKLLRMKRGIHIQYIYIILSTVQILIMYSKRDHAQNAY